jgi:hypothetical protein
VEVVPVHEGLVLGAEAVPGHGSVARLVQSAFPGVEPAARREERPLERFVALLREADLVFERQELLRVARPERGRCGRHDVEPDHRVRLCRLRDLHQPDAGEEQEDGGARNPKPRSAQAERENQRPEQRPDKGSSRSRRHERAAEEHQGRRRHHTLRA